MNILHIIIGIIIVGWGWLHACTLCGDLTQAVDVSVYESHTDEKMQLNIQWDFSKQFSAETLLDYDLNGNRRLDSDEIAQIDKMLTEYLKEENYLTHIKYASSSEEYDAIAYLPHVATNAKTKFTENQLSFSFTLDTDITPQKGHLLYLTFFDKGLFFIFHIRTKEQAMKQENNSTVLLDNSASLILMPHQKKETSHLTPLAQTIEPLIQNEQTNVIKNGLLTWLLLNTYMGHYFSDIESITTKVSAVIIILIALYLLYKRIPKKPKRVSEKTTLGGWSQSKPVATHEHSCGCGACQSQSTDIGVILSAGIIPCPGTVTVFIFTLSLGVYTVGLLSAIFMSIGMSLIIFIAAYLSLKVREKSSPNERIRQVLDYGSLVFILGLGVLLFLAT